jgi:Tol biopolymer transport system component
MLSTRLVSSWLPMTLLGAAASAQAMKLNVELPRLPVGDVELLAVSTDGTLAVYQADATTDEEYELFSVRADGDDDPVFLAALGPGGTCEISPDGSLAVFWADHDEDGAADLFSVPTDGSAAAVRLNPVPGHSVLAGFRLTADGSRAVYLASPTAGGERLYSVPIDGSPGAVELNQALSPFARVLGFQLDPAGVRAVYLVRTTGVDQIFSVPVDDSAAPVQLNGALVTNGDVLEYVVGAERVVYRADQDADEVYEVFGVPLDGSEPAVRLNRDLPAGGDVLAGSLALVGGGTAVVYIADARIDQRFELFYAATDGSRRGIRLSGQLTANGDVARVAVSPDGKWAVYAADQAIDGKQELYGIRLASLRPVHYASIKPPVRLNGLLPSGDGVIEFAISPESDRVVYLAGPTSGAGRRLYSVPIAGSAPALEISGALVAGGNVLWPASISPDGERVVYAAMQEAVGRVDLYSVPIDGSLAPVNLNGTLVPGGGSAAPAFRIGTDGVRVLYVTDQLTHGVHELFAVPLDGSSAAIRLNDPLSAMGRAGEVEDVRVSPDGLYAVYLADQEVVDRVEAYCVRLEPLSTPVRLNGSLVFGGDVLSLSISPDSQWLVYRADQDVDERAEIYAVPIDGSASAVKLNHALPLGGVGAFTISPLGDRVVYSAGLLTMERIELHSVPIDGSAAPTKLNHPLAPDADVQGFLTDGARVVYRAGPASLGGTVPVELYSVPIDGSASSVKLNPTPVAEGDVLPFFKISSLGRVVYRADQDADEVNELYSVPIDGSASAIKLNVAPVTGGDVAGTTFNPYFEITPDGTLVVYRGDQDTNDVDELYSVPIDGSAPPTKLNAPFAPMAADVQGLPGISPDGTYVVYQSDQDGLAGLDLSSVPIDGSAAPIVLTGSESLPITEFWSGSNLFQFGSGGARVVYVGRLAGVDELYSVPTDGSAAPVRVNDPPVAGGRVPPRPDAFQVTADGTRVVYVADQDTDGVHELFDAAIDGAGAAVKLNSPLPSGGDVLTDAIDPLGPIPRFRLTAGRAFHIGDQETDDVWELFMSDLVGF